MPRLVAVLILLAATLMLAAPVEAQSRREMVARMDRMDARIAEMDARFMAGDPVAESLMMRIDALEREQRAQTGEIERLAFENRRLREQVEALGLDVDALLTTPSADAEEAASAGPASLEPSGRTADPVAAARAAATGTLQMPSSDRPSTRPAGGGAGSALPAAGQSGGAGPAVLAGASVAEPAELFTEGRNRILDGDFSGAQDRFLVFTQTYPDDPLAGQAWYWLGETEFVQGDFQNAADAYLASLRAQRQGPRAPDALVRLAASFAALDQVDQACSVLASFRTEFPNADEEARRKAQREAARAGCR